MHDHDKGLAHDLQTLAAALQRRRTLRWMAGASLLSGTGALALLGCGGGGSDDSASSDDGSSDTPDTGTASCTLIPEETAGPFPGDGSNSNADGVANVLALSGVVRQDIRASIAGASGVAAGVPLTMQLRLVNTNGSCADLSGFAIYLWHCDRDGLYSMYDTAVADENYLRGVQATDSSGVATFTTIYPGCYLGRMPHMHFEVFASANSATSFSNKLRTSQVAFPNDVSNTVYASSGYAASAANFARISFATDNVFSDGVEDQLSSVTGSVDEGFVATLTIGISA